MNWPNLEIDIIYEVSIEVEIWSDQPIVKITRDDDLNHLRKEINVTCPGEAAQNPSGVAMKS